MARIPRTLAAALAAGTLIAAPGATLFGPQPAHAQQAESPAPLIVGNNWLFLIRTPDTLNGREWAIQDRIGHAQDVLAKHLGGPYARFTTKKWGERVHIYLNGDFLLAVTPADARATHFKSTEKLAETWLEKIRKAFEESHVRQSVPGRPPQ